MLLFMGLPHGWEWILLIVIGLLLFGKKLPGIARSLGQSVIEFKKGIKGEAEPPVSSSAPVAPSQPAPLPQPQAPAATGNVVNTTAQPVASQPTSAAGNHS